MKLNARFFGDNCPLRYYYCCIEKKEYILLGDNQGNIYDSDKYFEIGRLIIELLDNSQSICDTLLKYYELIEKDCTEDNEDDIQLVVMRYLHILWGELYNISNKYFEYFDIEKYVHDKYYEKYVEFSIKKAELDNINMTLKEFTKTLDVKSHNGEQIIKEFENRKLKIKQELDYYGELNYKNFTLNMLKNILLDFDIFEHILYFHYEDIVNIKLNNNVKRIEHNEKNDILQQHYNIGAFNTFQNIKCYLKMISLNNNKITFYESSKNYENSSLKMIKFYQFDNLIELLNLSLTTSIENKIIIKPCLNCYNFFIPESRTDEKYCNRKSPQNSTKTCKEYGANKTYREEIKSIPIKNEHNKTSQFFRMRISRAKLQKEKNVYETKFNKYKSEYTIRKEKYNLGKLSEKDFINWIIKQKDVINNGSARNNKK